MTAMTLVELVCRGAGHRAAVTGPDGTVLDYVSLCNAADALGSALVARGVAPGERVASALPPGRELAAALIGVAAIRGVFAPLPAVVDEPSARAALRARDARLLLAPASAIPGGVRAAAAALRIPIVRLGFDDHGLALIDGEHVFDSHDRIAEPQDLAFAPPAGKPLSHEQLVAAAGERGLDGLLAAVAGDGASLGAREGLAA
jgi:acyl-CoA synthetase (AMP-forming)/AMP-acid ligase II